jgi:hypothetical protein
MARPLIPFVRGGSYYPSRSWTPLVRENGFTTQDGGEEQGVPKTVSGSLLHILDALAAPVSALSVSINPVQSGSGDPAPDNVRPISGWTGVKLTRSGTNMISPAPAGETELNGVKFTSNGDGTYKIKGTASAYTTFEVNVEPFTIPISVAKGGNGVMVLNNSFVGVNGVGIGFYYNSTTIDTWGLSGINRISNAYAAMGGKLCNKWSVSIPSGASVDGTIAPMFRSDGVNTSGFVPFTGYDVVEVTWQTEAGTVYGGTLDVLTGVLTVDKVAVTIDGTNVKFNQVTAYGTLNRFGFAYPTGLAVKYTGNTSFCLSDKLAPSYNNTIAITTDRPPGFYCFPHSSAFFVSMPSDTYTTNAQANTWAAANTPVVCYELATHQTIQLTPAQLSTLAGENNVWADTGDTTMTYMAQGG